MTAVRSVTVNVSMSTPKRSQCFFELIGFAFQVTYVEIIMNTYLYTRILNTYLKMETAKK